MEWLNKIIADPYRIERLTYQEVKTINQLATDAEIRAAQIMGEGNTDNGRRGGARIFAGLEVDSAEPAEVGNLATSLQAAFAAFRKDHEPAEDVIEIGSST